MQSLKKIHAWTQMQVPLMTENKNYIAKDGHNAKNPTTGATANNE